ncbi:MAG: cupin domain-containing protein, partial [Tetragenococcus sp.]|nr:cupin domain-containing protein [Tetragenococcus sp.]
MEIISKPKLDYLGTVGNSPQWTFPLHEHENVCEILIILNGKGRMIINNEIYHVTRGDVIVFNSKTLHEEFSNMQSPIEFIYFGIRSLRIKGLEDNIVLPKTCSPTVNMSDYFPTIETLVSLIYQEFSDKEEDFAEVCSEQLSTIIHLLHRVSFLNERKRKFEPVDSQLIK